jgi:hypothetical protein
VTVLKPTTPRQVFAAKVQDLQLMWLAFPPNWEFTWWELPEVADALLHRFCTDDRMHEAWELLAQFDDDAFEDFIEETLIIVSDARRLPRHRASFGEWRRQIDEVGMMTRQFIKMCETSPVFASPLQLSEDGTSSETIGKYFPDLLAQAKQAYLMLAAESIVAWEREKEEVGDLSRKLGDGRTEIAHDLSKYIKRCTGQPHYEAIAALLNTILDDDEITADAVRKMCTRAVQRDRTIRPSK